MAKNATISPDLKDLYLKCDHGRTQPSYHESLNVFNFEVSRQDRISVVLDALDECEAVARDVLLKELEKAKPNTHLMATSRPLESIYSMFEAATTLEINATSEDIATYVNGRIARERYLSRHVQRDSSLQQKITETVSSKSDKM